MSAPSRDVWEDVDGGRFVSAFRSQGGATSSQLNRQLRSLASKVDDAFSRFQLIEGRPPSIQELRSAVLEAMGRTPQSSAPAHPLVRDVLPIFVSSMGTQNGWSESTYKKFRTLKRHLSAFAGDGLTLEEMDEPWLQRFLAYMERAELRNTTIVKGFGVLRWFMRWASRHGYSVPQDFELFRPRLKGTEASSHEVFFLEWDELMAVWSLDLSECSRLAHVRDVFCFCCFSGLRYSDVSHLRRADVDAECIRVVTRKTSDALRIELNSWTREILARYDGVPFDGGLALPVISNVKMNQYLKEVARMAGLDAPVRSVYFRGSERFERRCEKWELVTTHCARRTFVVNCLRLGIPSEVVMKWTGHSSFSSMRPYVAIVDELKSEAMARFDKKKPDPFSSGSGSGSGEP